MLCSIAQRKQILSVFGLLFRNRKYNPLWALNMLANLYSNKLQKKKTITKLVEQRNYLLREHITYELYSIVRDCNFFFSSLNFISAFGLNAYETYMCKPELAAYIANHESAKKKSLLA